MNDTPQQRDRQDPDADGNGDDDREEPRKLSFWQVVGSTLASAFGVQSSRNRERDFSRGNVWHFIVAGVVFTVLFVLAVIFVVNVVLSSAGAS